MTLYFEFFLIDMNFIVYTWNPLFWNKKRKEKQIIYFKIFFCSLQIQMISTKKYVEAFLSLFPFL